MNRFRGFSKEKGGTPKYDQGGSVSEIPADIEASAYRALGASFDLHGDICAEIMKERQRCADLLMARFDILMGMAEQAQKPMLLRSTAVELLDVREAILDGAIAVTHPSLPSSLPEREQA